LEKNSFFSLSSLTNNGDRVGQAQNFLLKPIGPPR
jgi:hypothetical protein